MIRDNDADVFRQNYIDVKFQRTRDKMRARLLDMGLTPIQAAPVQVARSVPMRCSPMCPYCRGDGYFRTHPDAKVGSKNYGKVEICPNYRRVLAREDGEEIPVDDADYIPDPGDDLDLDDDNYEFEGES